MKEIKEDKGRVRPVVEGDFQCDENGNSTRFYEILSIIGYVKDDGTKIGYISKTDVPIGTPITDTDYWYPFQVIAIPKGDKGDKGDDGKSAYDLYIEHGGTITPVEAWLESLQGKDGKDGQSLMLRITPDGQSLEISDDGGHTWYMFEKNFSKLRILGFINSTSELPINANIGDIYGVKLPNEEVEPGHSAYELWINTVKGWNADYIITKIYDYDTELPSYAANNTTVLVPVKYLTLDKQKIDGYKVYRFDQSKNGWTMILNTAEIFASKEDIVNHGDNVYALVQGESKKTYHDITNWINGSLDENNKYQEDATSIIGTCDIDGSVRELSYNIAVGYKASIKILSDVKPNPIDIDNPTIVYDTEVVEGIGSITVPSNAKSVLVIMQLTTEEEIPTSAGTMISMFSIKEEKIILYKRDTGWVYFGTNNSITYILIQNVDEGAEDNILSGKAVKDALDTKVDKEEGKSLIDADYAAGVNYIENEEFLKAYLDGNDKFLWGIRRADGDIVYGSGVPNQVKDYIQKKIDDLSLEEYEAIVTFLDGLEFDEDFKTLRQLLNEKVDKEEGKSLIDEDFANGVSYIENPEFSEVKLDNDGNILEAIYKNGNKLLGAGLKLKGPLTIDSSEFTTVENPEFLMVWLINDKILLAIDKKADIIFGVGIPKKIKTYIDSNIEKLIDAYGHYEDNVEYLKVYLDSEGKLIKATRTDGIEVFGVGYTIGDTETTVIENQEYLKVYLTSDGRILFGIKRDGDVIFGIGIPKQIKSYIDNNLAYFVNYFIDMYGKYEDNPEYLRVYLDSNGNIVKATRVDGLEQFGVGYRVSDIETTTVENPEYLRIYTTSDGYILLAIKRDGDIVFGCGIPKQIQKYIKSLITSEYLYKPDYLEAILDSTNKLLAGRNLDGSAFEKVGFSTPKLSIDGANIENIEDVEDRTEIITDGENKIISYRKKDGRKVETVGIETNSLVLTPKGMSDFQKALKDSGFRPGGAGDFSEKSEMYIPEPRCAFINIYKDNEPASWPQAKGVDMHCWMEFFDGVGNYFKKRIIFNAQGHSSLNWPKKNGAFDLCNDEWEGDDTFKVKIGDWVSQDSFHLKAYYTDFFRGVSIVCYKTQDEICATYPFDKDRPWKKALLGDYNFAPESYLSNQIDDLSLQMDNGARCMPDAFPCIVHLNGEFYGIYAFALKKHRDNYHMNKSTAEHIHLDGSIQNSSLFDGTIDWTAFEIRNPKSLYCMDGSKYDGDDPHELIDNTSPNYDSTNKNHKRSAKVKQYIINLSTRYNQIVSQATDADKKALMETYFDIETLIDYECLNEFVSNYDGYYGNWQWVTYDGIKWYVCNYDMDIVMGIDWDGVNLNQPTNKLWALTNNYTNAPSHPINLLWDLYITELQARYKVLRDANILSKDNIVGKIKTWMDRFGYDAFKKEYEKWNESPSNRDGSETYTLNPTTGGHYDTIYRVGPWLDKRCELIETADKFNY